MNNPNEQTAADLNRKIQQARAYYFHCMDCRLWDLAEKTRNDIAGMVAELNALSL